MEENRSALGVRNRVVWFFTDIAMFVICLYYKKWLKSSTPNSKLLISLNFNHDRKWWWTTWPTYHQCDPKNRHLSSGPRALILPALVNYGVNFRKKYENCFTFLLNFCSFVVECSIIASPRSTAQCTLQHNLDLYS